MKKIDIKKIIFLLVIVALIFTVAACSGGGNKDNGGDKKDPGPGPGPGPGPDPNLKPDVMKVLDGLLKGAGNLLNEVGAKGQDDFYAEAKLALNLDIKEIKEKGKEGDKDYVKARKAYNLDGALRIAGIVSKTKTNTVGIEIIDNKCTVNSGVRFGIYMEYIPGTTDQTTFYLATNFAAPKTGDDAPSLFKVKNLNEIPFDEVSKIIDLLKGDEESAGFELKLSELASTVTGLGDSISGMKNLVEGLIEAGESKTVGKLETSSLSINFSGIGAILDTLQLDLSSILGDLGDTVNGVLDSVLGFNLGNLKDVKSDSNVADLSIVTTVDKTVAENPILRGLMINYDFNGIKLGAGIENVFVKAYDKDAVVITNKSKFDDGALQLKLNLDVPGFTGSLANPALANVPFFAEAVLTFTGSSDSNADNNAVVEVYLYNNKEHETKTATLGYGTYVGADNALYFDAAALAEFCGSTPEFTKYKMTLDIRGEIEKAIQAGYEIVFNGNSQGRIKSDSAIKDVYEFDIDSFEAVTGNVVVELNGEAITPDALLNGITLSENKSKLTVNPKLFVAFAEEKLGENSTDASKRKLTVTMEKPAKLYDYIWTYGQKIVAKEIPGFKSNTYFKLLYKDAKNPEAVWENIVKTVDGKPIKGTYYVNQDLKVDFTTEKPGLYKFMMVTYPGESSAKAFSYDAKATKAGNPADFTTGTEKCKTPVIKEFTVKVEANYNINIDGTLLAKNFALEKVYFDFSAYNADAIELVKDKDGKIIKVGADGYGIAFLKEGEYTIPFYYGCTFDKNGVVASSLSSARKVDLKVSVTRKLDIMGLIGTVMDAYNTVKDAVDVKNKGTTPFSEFGETLRASFLNEILGFIAVDPAVFKAVTGVVSNETILQLIDKLDESLDILPGDMTFQEFMAVVSAPAGATQAVKDSWTIDKAIDAWIAFYNTPANYEKVGREAGAANDASKPADYTLGGIAEWAIGNWGYEAGKLKDPSLTEEEPGYGETYATSLWDDIMKVVNKILSAEAKAQINVTVVDPEAPTKAEQLAKIKAYLNALEIGVVDGTLTEQEIAGKKSDVFYGELYAVLNDGTDSVRVLELGGSFAVVSKSYITTLQTTVCKIPTDLTGVEIIEPKDAMTIADLFLGILKTAVGLEEEAV